MKGLSIAFCGFLAIAAVAVGLWIFPAAQELVLDNWSAARPELAEWAVRAAAVALIALGETVLLAGVVGRLYRQGPIDAALTFASAAVCALATVAAVACGLAGR